MATVAARPTLGVFRGDDWPLTPPRRTRPVSTSEREQGYPKVIGRSNGYPLEVRVWHSRPVGIADAVYHPSGCWLTVRVLGWPPASS